MKFIIYAVILSSLYSGFVYSKMSEIKSNQWDGYNNPYKMNPNFISAFNSLPLEGEIGSSSLAWGDSYWPNNKGSIAWRWTSTNPQNFRYTSPSLYTAQGMTESELNELSPAEKYDLYVGSYDYPTVKKVWSVTSPSSPTWYGICHGIAPASLHHTEPETLDVINNDGIKIRFYSSDVKALLGHHYARESKNGIIQVGKRCFFRGFGSACSDVNAGSFHIILGNKLGISKTGFVADIDRFKQVWNHAAISYTSTTLGEAYLNDTSSILAVKRIKINTTVKYTASIDPSKTPVMGSDLEKYDIRKYAYYLELDEKEKIVGGSWISYERPDFLWYKKKDKFEGHWSKLYEIYKPTKVSN